MFLYEEVKDKVLVYEFSPKKEDILDYKKAYLERTPNSKLFYLLSSRPDKSQYLWTSDDSVWLETAFDNSREILKASLYSRSQYHPSIENETSIKKKYLFNNGFLVESDPLDFTKSYFVSRKAIGNKEAFVTEILKISDRLKELWELEHERFPSTYYSDIMKLFDFFQSNEFNKKDIDELIICGLINQSHLDYHKEETKVLKRIYNRNK